MSIRSKATAAVAESDWHNTNREPGLVKAITEHHQGDNPEALELSAEDVDAAARRQGWLPPLGVRPDQIEPVESPEPPR